MGSTRPVGSAVSGLWALRCLMLALGVAASGAAMAQDATWLANPGSGDFNTAANWNPAVVPGGTASFGASNTTALTVSATVYIYGFTFLSGAPAYTFTINPAEQLLFSYGSPSGGGIVNGGSATFINNGDIIFYGYSTAGSATIINNSGLAFYYDSTPGSATIVNNGSIAFDSSGPNGDSKISAGSIAGGGSFQLAGLEELTVGSNNLSTTVSGTIQSSGSLVKIGSGTLTFSNTSLLLYRGPTTVDGGTLEVDSTLRSSSVTVNAGGTLSGTGLVFDATIAGGTLAPGNPANPTGTLTVNTNLAFQSGAIYLVTLSGANAANTNVSFGAAASLAGTVQGAVGAGGAVLTSYDILHADGGLGGTTFSGVSVPNYDATLTYSATDVFLDVTAAALGTGSALNGNEQAVAGAINSFVNNGGALPPTLGNIFGLTGGNLANALTQLDGEAATGAETGSFQLMNDFFALLSDTSFGGSSGSGGSAGGAASGFAAEDDAGFPPDVALAYNSVLKKRAPVPAFDHQLDHMGFGLRRLRHIQWQRRRRLEQCHGKRLWFCRRHGLSRRPRPQARLRARRRRHQLEYRARARRRAERLVPGRRLRHQALGSGLPVWRARIRQQLVHHQPHRGRRPVNRELCRPELRRAAGNRLSLCGAAGSGHYALRCLADPVVPHAGLQRDRSHRRWLRAVIQCHDGERYQERTWCALRRSRRAWRQAAGAARAPCLGADWVSNPALGAVFQTLPGVELHRQRRGAAAKFRAHRRGRGTVSDRQLVVSKESSTANLLRARRPTPVPEQCAIRGEQKSPITAPCPCCVATKSRSKPTLWVLSRHEVRKMRELRNYGDSALIIGITRMTVTVH